MSKQADFYDEIDAHMLEARKARSEAFHVACARALNPLRKLFQKPAAGKIDKIVSHQGA